MKMQSDVPRFDAPLNRRVKAVVEALPRAARPNGCRRTGGVVLIKFSDDALAYAAEKKMPLHIDAPYQVSGCCFDMTECPAVRFGEPAKPEDYTRQEYRGVTLYIPNDLGDDGSLTIRTQNVFGFRRLVIDGWKLA